MTNYDGHGGWRHRRGGFKDVLYQCPAGHLMKDLGLGRLHSRSLAGSQNDDVRF
jgi:hypothetical protein